MGGSSHMRNVEPTRAVFPPIFFLSFHFCKISSIWFIASNPIPTSITRSASSNQINQMGTLITGPVLGASPSSESEMAWHLAALLLSVGQPARPADLASRCTLFTASPELVEFLCSIPKSPIFLTTDLYVTLSAVALVAVGRFISVTHFISTPLLPRVGIRVSSTASWWNDFNTSGMCFRKRKRRYYSDCDFLPAEKRVVNSYSIDGNKSFPFRFRPIS